MNYFDLLNDALQERNKTFLDLEKEKIISKNVFYSYKHKTPSLSTLIQVANYLQMSISYILDQSSENKSKKYSLYQNYYKNINNALSAQNISQRALCRELEISRTNFSRWKSGVQPSLSILLEIAKYLKCSIDDILEK